MLTAGSVFADPELTAPSTEANVTIKVEISCLEDNINYCSDILMESSYSESINYNIF